MRELQACATVPGSSCFFCSFLCGFHFFTPRPVLFGYGLTSPHDQPPISCTFCEIHMHKRLSSRSLAVLCSAGESGPGPRLREVSAVLWSCGPSLGLFLCKAAAVSRRGLTARWSLAVHSGPAFLPCHFPLSLWTCIYAPDCLSPSKLLLGKRMCYSYQVGRHSSYHV